jgi:hypothetical protein
MTAEQTLITAHRRWIREQRKRYPMLPVNGTMSLGGIPACTNCGCTGNGICQHECLDPDKACTLDDGDTCPCCAIAPDPMTDAEYDAAIGQAGLFREVVT